MVYNIVAYTCLVQPLFSPFFDLLPAVYVWGILPWIIVNLGVFMIYYFQVVYDPIGSLDARGVVYLYGVLYNFVAIWVSYFLACFVNSYLEKNAPQKETKITIATAARRMSVQVAPVPMILPTSNKDTVKKKVLIDYLPMFIVVLMLSMMHAGMYAWCSYFTNYYAAQVALHGPDISALLVVMFLLITSCGTMIIRFLGNCKFINLSEYFFLQ